MQLGKSNFQSTYHTHKNLADTMVYHGIAESRYHGFKKNIQDENPDQLMLQPVS